MKCIKCGYESEQDFNSCPSCGIIVNEYVIVQKELDNIQTRIKRRLLISGFIGLLVVIIFAFFWFLIVNQKEKPSLASRPKSQNVQPAGIEVDIVSEPAKEEALLKPKKIKENQIKAIYLKGAKYGSQGEIYRAKEKFLTILEKNPDHKPSNMALKLLDSVSEENNENIGLKLYFQGVVLQEENKSKDDALTAYKQSALYIKTMGLKKFAIDILEKAISINPKDAQLYYDVGILWADEGMWDKAELAFSQVVKIDPANRDAINKLGLVYGLQEKWNDAIRTFQTLTPMWDKDGEMDYHLALAYYYTKQFDLSKKHADRALQLGYKVNPVLITKLNNHINK